MWLNSTAQNAVRAVLFIAEAEGDEPVRVDDIAEALGCPRNYLSKTLHTLARLGVLASLRGRHGGFRLVDAPENLSLARIVAPFQPAGERRCLLGRATCGGANPCRVHDRWAQVATQIESFFGNTTVAELLTLSPEARNI